MPRHYYERIVPGKMVGTLTRPIAGLNEYTPPTEITDSHLSDCIDVEPYRDHALNFTQRTLSHIYFSEVAGNIGTVRSVLSSYLSNEDAYEFTLYVMTYDATSGWRIISAIRTGEEDFTDIKTMTATNEDGNVSSCVFNTEAERFYCFANDVDDRLHFIRESNGAYGYVDLPFTPKKMVVHANRIFMISDNTLWWCRAGDLFSWYSLEYDEDAISTAQNMKNGALTVTSQPNTGRLITFLHTVVAGADTVGKVTIIGEYLGEAQTEVLDLISGGLTVSSKRYDVITSITQSGWSAVSTADTITIGVGPVGSKYVQADAGYWTVEREQLLYDMCVLNDNIYLFGPHNIYIFQGYSYDTFSLQQIISDVGITPVSTTYGSGFASIAVIKNTAFFIYNEELYSFDGNTRPVVISHPVTTNGGSINGVFSGINMTGNLLALAADDSDLFVYRADKSPTYFYKYNYQTKTWWKMSGLTKTDVSATDDITVMYVPSYTRKFMFLFVSILTAAAPEWLMSIDHGKRQGTAYPYIVTKAFNMNTSDDGSVSEIVLRIKGKANTTGTIVLSFSNKDNGATFTTIKTLSNHSFTGDTEIIAVKPTIAMISRQHHYRLKLTMYGTYPIYLMDIERRHRVIRRSR